MVERCLPSDQGLEHEWPGPDHGERSGLGLRQIDPAEPLKTKPECIRKQKNYRNVIEPSRIGCPWSGHRSSGAARQKRVRLAPLPLESGPLASTVASGGFAFAKLVETEETGNWKIQPD